MPEIRIEKYLIISIIAGVTAGLALVISVAGILSNGGNAPRSEDLLLVDLPEDFRDLSSEEVAELVVTLGKHVDRLDKDVVETLQSLTSRMNSIEGEMVPPEDWARWREDLISLTQDTKTNIEQTEDLLEKIPQVFRTTFRRQGTVRWEANWQGRFSPTSNLGNLDLITGYDEYDGPIFDPVSANEYKGMQGQQQADDQSDYWKMDELLIPYSSEIVGQSSSCHPEVQGSWTYTVDIPKTQQEELGITDEELAYFNKGTYTSTNLAVAEYTDVRQDNPARYIFNGMELNISYAHMLLTVAPIIDPSNPTTPFPDFMNSVNVFYHVIMVCVRNGQ